MYHNLQHVMLTASFILLLAASNMTDKPVSQVRMPNWNRHYVVDIAVSLVLTFLLTKCRNTGFHYVMLSGAKRSRNIPGNGHLVLTQ